MRLGIDSIRRWYKVPAKQGSRVRDIYNRNEKRILSGKSGQYLSVADEATGKRSLYHPFDLDYWVDGKWILGDEYKATFDAARDKWNEGFRNLHSSD